MKSVWKARFIMTDYYYPVLSDETSLPLYVLGIGARDREFHFVREDGYPNHQIIYCTRGQGHRRREIKCVPRLYIILMTIKYNVTLTTSAVY